LAFGNFLFAPIKCKKTVLLHHPYLVDDQLFKKLGSKSKFNELLKRIAFSLTTKNTETIVVQSDYMKRQLENKHGKGKFLIKVIPNPISKSFDNDSKILNHPMVITRVESLPQTLDLLYVSRYSPHKNHRFLVEVSKKLNYHNINHRIMVTIDPLIVEANNFLIDTVGNGVSIINLTELEQAQLIEHYQNAHLFIFPSSAETFGNPLIEAMCYGLPILVPNLEYARSIVGDAGTYFHEDNVEDCVDQVKSLINNPDLYLFKSKQSLQQFKNYPTTTEWFGQYMTLIS
jgi:glycosyltransferase involved in cell wall biosynthesis